MSNFQLDDYLVVAERECHPVPTPLTFLTGITNLTDAKLAVVDRIDDLNIDARVYWAQDGLAAEFKNSHDLTLFTLAFENPDFSKLNMRWKPTYMS